MGWIHVGYSAHAKKAFSGKNARKSLMNLILNHPEKVSNLKGDYPMKGEKEKIDPDYRSEREYEISL